MIIRATNFCQEVQFEKNVSKKCQTIGSRKNSSIEKICIVRRQQLKVLFYHSSMSRQKLVGPTIITFIYWLKFDAFSDINNFLII